MPKKRRKKRKEKSNLKKLQEQADELVKQIVRLRDDWTCQKCDKYIRHDLPRQQKNAHTAHVIAKSQSSNLRWDLLNVVLLSFHEHQAFHIRGGMDRWFKKKWPHRWRYLNEPVRQKGITKPRCNHNWIMAGCSLREKEEWMRKVVSELQIKYEDLKSERN